MERVVNSGNLSRIRNSNCKLCPIHESARTVCVMGTGNERARLFFLGESPGDEEDKKGIPFIGKAGKMFDSILINTGINRSDCFVSNVLKCHPYFNTKPNVTTIDICANKYLRQELKLVRPELIVCMGGLAARTMLQERNTSVVAVRKQIFYTQAPMPVGIPFIVTYHPAATLYSGGDNLLDFIVEDMEWAVKLLAGELPKPARKTAYTMGVNPLKISGIKDAKVLSLDLETDGLDPWVEGKEILSVQLCVEKGKAFYYNWDESIAKRIRYLLSGKFDFILNGHNIKHDLKWLRVKAGVSYTGKVNDTIQDIHLLDENFPSKGLDTVAGTFTELKGHKNDFVKIINTYIKLHKDKKEPIRQARGRLWGQAFNAVPLSTRVSYGCGDADATHRLRRVFKPKLEEQGLTPLHNLLTEAVKMYTDIEVNGIKVDKSLVQDYEYIYRGKLKRRLRRLAEIADINPRSYPQLSGLLYTKWRLPDHPVKVGKKVKHYTTAADALELLLNDDLGDEQHEYIKSLLTYRKQSKLYGTYVKGMPRYLRGGFIHANWNLIGAETGRNSCTDPGLQQIPRKGDSTGSIKKLFISRFEDGVLVQADVSQGELRIAAHSAEEPTLIRLFNNISTDIHKAVAAELLNIPLDQVTDDQRFNAKTVNFLVLYGGGARTMAQGMKGVDEEEAFRFIRTWHKRFSGWKRYVNSIEEFVINNGYVRNIFGRYRRIFVMDPTTDDGKTQLRQAINAPIQGGLADYMKLCGVALWKRINSPLFPSGECLMIGEVHDSFWFDVRKHHVKILTRIIKEEFENVDTSEFGFTFKVPMRVDIKIGPNLEEMEEYEV